MWINWSSQTIAFYLEKIQGLYNEIWTYDFRDTGVLLYRWVQFFYIPITSIIYIHYFSIYLSGYTQAIFMWQFWCDKFICSRRWHNNYLSADQCIVRQ